MLSTGANPQAHSCTALLCYAHNSPTTVCVCLCNGRRVHAVAHACAALRQASTDSWSYHRRRRGGATSSRGIASTITFTSQGDERECSAPKAGCTHGQALARGKGMSLCQADSGHRQRTASLLDAGDCCTANSCTKSNLPSQQALPVLWLECRFCLSSPSTNSIPAGTPLNSAFVEPRMAERVRERKKRAPRPKTTPKQSSNISNKSTPVG